MAEFKELEHEKQELINRYKIRVELAKLDNMKQRASVLLKTLNCFKNSRSAGEIDHCKDGERKRLMDKINSSSIKSANFKKEKKSLLKKYQNRIKASKIEKKSFILTENLNCIKKSETIHDLNICKNNEEEKLTNLFVSYEDNTKLQATLNKNELIDRYKIRLEIARIDRMYDRVSIFSKTLTCLRNSTNVKDVNICKKKEKNRILTLIRS